jgi:hypothetical protein
MSQLNIPRNIRYQSGDDNPSTSGASPLRISIISPSPPHEHCSLNMEVEVPSVMSAVENGINSAEFASWPTGLDRDLVRPGYGALTHPFTYTNVGHPQYATQPGIDQQMSSPVMLLTEAQSMNSTHIMCTSPQRYFRFINSNFMEAAPSQRELPESRHDHLHPSYPGQPQMHTDGSIGTSQQHQTASAKLTCSLPYCNKTFTKKHNLKSTHFFLLITLIIALTKQHAEDHMRAHDNIRSFKCRYCELTFVRSSDRRRHEKKYCKSRPQL